MKTYELDEAIKMLKENPKLSFQTQTMGDKSILYRDKEGVLRCENKRNRTESHIYFNEKWELIQQPISFMEAVKSEKRVKLEHVILTKLTKCRETTLKEYKSLPDLMYLLGRELLSEELREVILNGKWYIEE